MSRIEITSVSFVTSVAFRIILIKMNVDAMSKSGRELSQYISSDRVVR